MELKKNDKDRTILRKAETQSSGWNPLPIISVAVFLICLSAQTIYCFERPVSPLDSFVYVSLLNGGSQQAFRDAGPACVTLVPGPRSGCGTAKEAAYQQVASYSPADYSTFLRFYRVKPLYTWAAAIVQGLFHQPSFIALRAISAGSYLVIALVMALWLRRHLSVPAACLIALLIACISQVLALGRFLLPDAFSTALMLPILYAVLYRTRKLWVQLTLLAILPLARPDNILLCALYGAVLVYRATDERRVMWLRMAGLAAGCVLLNTFLQHATHALSYTILFNHSFLAFSNPSLYPRLHLSLHDYVHIILWSGFRTIVLYFPLPTLFAALALADETTWRPLRDLVAVCTLTAFARLLLFPAQEERYYTWFFIIAAVAAAATLGTRVLAKYSWFARRPEELLPCGMASDGGRG